MPHPQTTECIKRLNQEIAYRKGFDTSKAYEANMSNLLDEALDVILTLSGNEENLFDQIQSLKDESKHFKEGYEHHYNHAGSLEKEIWGYKYKLDEKAKQITELHKESRHHKEKCEELDKRLEEAKGQLALANDGNMQFREELKIAQHEIARLTERNIELSKAHNITVNVDYETLRRMHEANRKIEEINAILRRNE